MITITKVTDNVADLVLSITSEPWAVLLLVNVFLLVVGCFMETIAAITILVPVFTPIIAKLGIDPIHFGILIDANMEVGLCHPPVGLNLYVASGISKLSITELTMAVMPWLMTMVVFLIIVTYWPSLSIWLPKLMGMM